MSKQKPFVKDCALPPIAFHERSLRDRWRINAHQTTYCGRVARRATMLSTFIYLFWIEMFTLYTGRNYISKFLRFETSTWLVQWQSERFVSRQSIEMLKKLGALKMLNACSCTTLASHYLHLSTSLGTFRNTRPYSWNSDVVTWSKKK